MATIKISDLPSSELNSSSNTSNIYFVIVDASTNTTYKATETQLSQSIFNSNVLNVGQAPIIFPNISAQVSGNSSPYLQINHQNLMPNSSVDFIGTADVGTNLYNYIDLGINGSTFSDATYSSMNALDGYLYVQGSSLSPYSGNLVIGTASSSANIVFIAGGTTSSNVVGRMSSNKMDILVPSSISANSNTAAFTINQLGNGASFIINDQTVPDATPFYIDSNGNVGIATTNTANNKLTVVGDSYFTGNVMFSDLSIQTSAAASRSTTNSIFSQANDAFVQANAAYIQANAAFVQANTANTRVTGANTFLQANDAITLGLAKSYTDSANTYIRTGYIANTSGVSTSGDFNVSGNLAIKNAVAYTPRILFGAQTAITINFSTDSLVRATMAANLTMSFANYSPGRVVEVWITNTSGASQNLIHGLVAVNSTANNYLFSIPGNSTIVSKFISFASDIGNTFNSITHI